MSPTDPADETRPNLLAAPAGVAETRLPDDPAASSSDDLETTLAAHPTSSLLWAELAERSLAEDSLAATLAAYAYARTGYHRGLDALRRAGWRGTGPIPWEHEPNRGFLRALWALAVAADRIGETDEHQRCAQFLRDSTATGFAALAR